MRREILKRVALSVLCACLLAAVFSGSAAAEAGPAGTRNLPEGFVIGDQDGIHAKTDGTYCIQAEGLRPGEVVRKIVTIQNLELKSSSPEWEIPWHLSMLAQPGETTGPINLLDRVQLVMKLDGKTVYTGPCRGDGAPNMVANALSLGEYAPGEKRVLDITLTADADWEPGGGRSEALFQWHFYAYRDVDAVPPKTGFAESYGPYAAIGGCLALCALLFFLKKGRERRAAQAL